jgi:hypothetical protein
MLVHKAVAAQGQHWVSGAEACTYALKRRWYMAEVFIPFEHCGKHLFEGHALSKKWLKCIDVE